MSPQRPRPAIVRSFAPVLLAVAAWPLAVHAQSPQGPASSPSSRIYRCGNAYTNDVAEAQARGCRLLEGGNVTVVQGTRVQAPPRTAPGAAVVSAGPGASTTVASAGGPRVDTAEQRARDADARQILEAELRKAEARHAELLKEYNNGEPEKLGPETRNHQKYLDRVAELKAGIARSEADIAGIRRELGRMGAPAAASQGAAASK